MNTEILGKSLKLAVDKAFYIDPWDEFDISQTVQGLPQHNLDTYLNTAYMNQHPGLRAEVASALLGADVTKISHVFEKSHVQARFAVRRKAARFAVQNCSLDSRIKPAQLNEWNSYGYAL